MVSAATMVDSQCSALELEVAASAVREGFSAALEDRSGGQGAPSDVLLRRGPHAVRVETFAVIPDERFREERAYWDRVMAGIRSIDWQYDVSVAGTSAITWVIQKQLNCCSG